MKIVSNPLLDAYVSFCCCEDTMTKATDKNEHLIRDFLIVSEGPFVNIINRERGRRRHGAGTVTVILHLGRQDTHLFIPDGEP